MGEKESIEYGGDNLDELPVEMPCYIDEEEVRKSLATLVKVLESQGFLTSYQEQEKDF